MKRNQVLGILVCCLMIVMLTACSNNADKNAEDGKEKINTENVNSQSEEKTSQDTSEKIENTTERKDETQSYGLTENNSESASEQEVIKDESEVVSIPKAIESEKKQGITSMKVQIGDVTFTATLEKNTATDELVTLLREGALVLNLSDYSGFEKVGSLGKSLTTSNKQITTQTGDIVLYNGNQIVLFYGPNSWSYTKLGRIDDLTGWENALGSGDIQVTLSINE